MLPGSRKWQILVSPSAVETATVFLHSAQPPVSSARARPRSSWPQRPTRVQYQKYNDLAPSRHPDDTDTYMPCRAYKLPTGRVVNATVSLPVASGRKLQAVRLITTRGPKGPALLASPTVWMLPCLRPEIQACDMAICYLVASISAIVGHGKHYSICMETVCFGPGSRGASCLSVTIAGAFARAVSSLTRLTISPTLLCPLLFIISIVRGRGRGRGRGTRCRGRSPSLGVGVRSCWEGRVKSRCDMYYTYGIYQR